MSKRYRIRHDSDEILEELKRKHIVHVKGVLVSSTVRELKDKSLVKVGKPNDSEKHVFVEDESTGYVHEVREDLLEPYEE